MRKSRFNYTTSVLIRHKKVALIVFCLLLIIKGIAIPQWFEEQLPPLPPPSQYGNLIINRVSDKSDKPPVTFSHWVHRIKHTCKVCHLELEFEMKVNATEITEEKNKNGQFCGACHNGKIAFGHTEENCKKCHNGNIDYSKEKFKELASLPKNKFGNRIDWAKAIKRRLIKPKRYIFDEEYSPAPFKKLLTLESEWTGIPPSIFPHEAHIAWLDCSNCHPDIFNIKKKTTKHFLMTYLLEGKFCGVCHLKIAFPLDDCKRCHPGIASKM